MQALPTPQLHQPTTYTPIQPQSAPPASRKRALPSGERSTPTDRAILPRPANLGQSNGGDKLVFNPVSPSEILEPARKKRGRPSNKALEERRAAAAARGEPYESPKPSTARKPKKSSIPTPSSGNLGVPEPVRAPAASPDPLQTPQPPPTAKSSDSSGGKKRKRGTKSDTPSSPVSASKKRDSPRETKHRQLDQSPTTSAPRPFPTAQQAEPHTQFPRGSIEGLLSATHDSPTSRKPEDVQMARTETVASAATTQASPKRIDEPTNPQN